MNLGYLIFFGGLAVGGFGTLLVTMISRHRGRASRAWPHVNGHVLRSEVSRGDSSTQPVVSYAYQVDGKSYSGRKICFGTEVSFLSRDQAQKYADRYPRGGDVVVYYDPTKPQLSVLQPGIPKHNRRLLKSGTVMAVIGVIGSLICAALQ